MRRIILVATLVFLATSASAIISPIWPRLADDVPLERLLKAAEGDVAAHPELARTHFILARVHYFAFAFGQESIPARFGFPAAEHSTASSKAEEAYWLTGKRHQHAVELTLKEFGVAREDLIARRDRKKFEAKVASQEAALEQSDWRPKFALSPSERVVHAQAALREFRAALLADRASDLMILGAASLEEQIVDWMKAGPGSEIPDELRSLNYEHAQAEYLRAYDAAVPTRVDTESFGVRWSEVKLEAGNGFLRLARRLPASGTDKDKATEVEKTLPQLRKMSVPNREVITPIIFTLKSSGRIGDLLDESTVVNFDLSGSARGECWPWLKPSTALLVWDSASSGRIVSGRQLFGGYTFRIFRTDGYEALAALDDNRDGELRGDELRGIRAWFDRNSDGVSTPDEVVDLSSLGIVAISVRATAQDGIHPTNPQGITFADGRVLPTWDWIAEPAKN